MLGMAFATKYELWDSYVFRDVPIRVVSVVSYSNFIQGQLSPSPELVMAYSPSYCIHWVVHVYARQCLISFGRCDLVQRVVLGEPCFTCLSGPAAKHIFLFHAAAIEPKSV